MSKIFKQEIANTRENTTIGEITNIISKELQYPEPTPFQKTVMAGWFSLLSWGIFAFGLLLGIIVGVSSTNVAISGLIIFFLCGGSIIMMFLTGTQKKKYRKAIAGCLQDKQGTIYKLWFEKNYDDIEVSATSDTYVMESNASRFRGSGIPGDARISAYAPGYQMKSKNGAFFDFAVVTWRWVRSNGKSSTTYYRKKVYIAAAGFKDAFNDFQFSMSKNGLFNKKRNELENEKFNKTWVYNHNDPVKLRMMLTPSVQEDVLNIITNQSFEMVRIGNMFWMTEEIPMSNSTFVINTRGKVDYSSKDFVVQNLVRDVISDIADFQQWLITASVFRTLFKTI